MKVKIIPEEIYTIELNGERISGFKKMSSWEGMTKFVKGSDVVIVDNYDSVFNCFLGLFNQEVESNIIKITPSLPGKFHKE